MSESSYVGVPPDSTGKKVAAEARSGFLFDGEVNGGLASGNVITGATSGATGTITAIVRDGYAANSGEIYLKEVTGTFVNDENIQISGQTRAVVNGSQADRVTQHVVLADPDNPDNKQKITASGSQLTEFAEGSPIFSPFGRLEMAHNQLIKEYAFQYHSWPQSFYDDTANGSTLTHESARGTVLMTTPTTSNSSVTRTSHFYNPYIPGVGTLFMITAEVGDSGKANVTRRWGFYDDNNGFFFELSGTALRIVRRSSTSGSPVDTVVEQANWNADNLLGPASPPGSSSAIDLTLANIYWIDFQWLGAGVVHYGTYNADGKRVICHTMKHANTVSLPYTKTASLPVRWEQFNTGASGSSSEFRVGCTATYHDVLFNIGGQNRSDYRGPMNIASADGEVAMIGIQPKLTYFGVTNHNLIRFDRLDVSVNSDATSPVLVRARSDTTENGEYPWTWVDQGTLYISEVAKPSDTNVGVASVAVNSGGTGYVVDDILTVAGGTGTAATLRVTSVSGGVIDGIDVETSGDYSVAPTTTANAVTGGSGTTATIDLTMTNPQWKYTATANTYISKTAIVGPGQTLSFFNEAGKNQHENEIFLENNGTVPRNLVFTVEVLEPASTADVSFAANWKEVIS